MQIGITVSLLRRIEKYNFFERLYIVLILIYLKTEQNLLLNKIIKYIQYMSMYMY